MTERRQASSRQMQVRRHHSELGDWELVTASAHSSLRGDVRRYAGYREVSPGVVRRLEPASPNSLLVISFGPIFYRTVDKRDDPYESIRSFLGGPTAGWTLVEYAGFQSGVQIDLGSLTLARLLGEPLTGPVALNDALGTEGVRLTDRLAEAPDWSTRFGLADDFLRRRLDRTDQPPADVAWAVRRLQSSGGRVGVGALSREIGWSRRHFISRFKSAVGTTPGVYARLLRFRRALRMIERGDRLSHVALAAGYFDHAHLDRDFRQFAGYSPTEYTARRLPDGFGLSG